MTVVGTLTWYQLAGWNFGVERTSPLASTLPDDCSDQPSVRRALSVAETAGFGLGFVWARPENGSKEKTMTQVASVLIWIINSPCRNNFHSAKFDRLAVISWRIDTFQ